MRHIIWDQRAYQGRDTRMLRGLNLEEGLGIDSKTREDDREALDDRVMEEAQGARLSLVKEAQDGIPSLVKQGIIIKEQGIIIWEIRDSFRGIEEMIDQDQGIGMMVNS